MRRFLSVLLVSVLVISVAVSFTARVGADFGDYGGDADYGGYDDYDYDYYDYDYDDDYGYGPSRSLFSFVPDAAVMIIIVAIIVIISMVAKKNKNNINVQGGRSFAPRVNTTPSLSPIESYGALDPSFSAADFKEWVSNSYIRLQRAWQNKDLSPVQTILSDAFYAQMTSQLDAYIKLRRTNVIERPAVLGVTLLGWRSDAGQDIIVAELRTRIKDYVVEDDTGKIVGGDAEHEKFMEYEWTLTRTGGVTTSRDSGTVAANCPNCGAPIDLNKSAICPYCDSVIKKERHDWVISTIRGISQQTVR